MPSDHETSPAERSIRRIEAMLTEKAKEVSANLAKRKGRPMNHLLWCIEGETGLDRDDPDFWEKAETILVRMANGVGKRRGLARQLLEDIDMHRRRALQTTGNDLSNALSAIGRAG